MLCANVKLYIPGRCNIQMDAVGAKPYADFHAPPHTMIGAIKRRHCLREIRANLHLCKARLLRPYAGKPVIIPFNNMPHHIVAVASGIFFPVLPKGRHAVFYKGIVAWVLFPQHVPGSVLGSFYWE